MDGKKHHGGHGVISFFLCVLCGLPSSAGAGERAAVVRLVAGGDSRSAAAQRVQQLVQKRSQMVELLSNSLKTLHDNSMAVNRNIRT